MQTSLQQWFLFIGAIFGFLGVSIGAFGAHFLKQKLATESLAILEIGVRYQMYHALAIISVALLMSINANNWINLAGFFFIFGVVIFSGSLYMLAITGIKIWGAVTPIGGVLLLLGWMSLAISPFIKSVN